MIGAHLIDLGLGKSSFPSDYIVNLAIENVAGRNRCSHQGADRGGVHGKGSGGGVVEICAVQIAIDVESCASLIIYPGDMVPVVVKDHGARNDMVYHNTSRIIADNDIELGIVCCGI